MSKEQKILAGICTVFVLLTAVLVSLAWRESRSSAIEIYIPETEAPLTPAPTPTPATATPTPTMPIAPPDEKDLSGSKPTKPIAKPCIVSGCSSQICGEESLMSTCEYREEYTCYQKASCERQADGACGWTMTETLRSCLGASGRDIQ